MFGRPYSILKEDQLLDIIRKFQEVLIETVKIRFEQPVLNDSILLKLWFSELFYKLRGNLACIVKDSIATSFKDKIHPLGPVFHCLHQV